MKIKIPFQIILLLSTTFICASTPTSHLKYHIQKQLKNEFYKNHDLSLFVKPWPVLQINDNHKNNVQLSVISTFRVWNNDPIESLDFQGISKWGRLSLMVEPIIVNEPYGPSLLGVDYTRSGISGRIFNAFIRYGNDLITLQLGRSPLLWGQSINRSIIQSTVTPSYDHMDLRMNIGWFQLEMLAGGLGSEILQTKRIKRHIACHRLTWISKDQKIFASFGEQIVYTGINREFEWHYLNPFVPYFFTALESEEESSTNGNNDNSIIFATMRYVYKPNLSIFWELLIDDFQVDDNNYQDGLGYKIGIDGAFDISGKPITWGLEWTSINSWTYIHHGQYTSWQNKGHALGFLYGPDLRSLYLHADMQINKSLLVNIEAELLEKGSNTLSTEWGNADNKGDPFPKPPVTHHTLLTTSLSWYWQYGMVEGGWSNYDFPHKIAFNDPQAKNDGSFFLKVQLFYKSGFDLK